MLAMVIGMTAIAYTVQAKQAKSTNAVKQEGTITIKGTVKDRGGNVLPGATVTVKERPQIGVVTSIDGTFTIKVAIGETLVFKYLGFQDKEQKVTKNTPTTLNIVMDEGEQILD